MERDIPSVWRCVLCRGFAVLRRVEHHSGSRVRPRPFHFGSALDPLRSTPLLFVQIRDIIPSLSAFALLLLLHVPLFLRPEFLLLPHPRQNRRVSVFVLPLGVGVIAVFFPIRRSNTPLVLRAVAAPLRLLLSSWPLRRALRPRFALRNGSGSDHLHVLLIASPFDNGCSDRMLCPILEPSPVLLSDLLIIFTYFDCIPPLQLFYLISSVDRWTGFHGLGGGAHSALTRAARSLR